MIKDLLVISLIISVDDKNKIHRESSIYTGEGSRGNNNK